MKQIMSVVDKLDVRRAQVLIEAILVEISSTIAARARRELGDRQSGRKHRADRHVQSNRRRLEHRQHHLRRSTIPTYSPKSDCRPVSRSAPDAYKTAA